MIADQVVGRPRHRDSVGKKSHLQFAQDFFSPPVGVGDECVNKDTAFGGVHHGTFQLSSIETEDHHLDALARLFDATHKCGNTVAGLDQKFHWFLGSQAREFALQSNRIPISINSDQC